MGGEEERDAPGRSGDQDGATGDFAFLDHLKDNGGGFASFVLAHQTLRGCARLERVGVDTETPDVGVRRDEVHAADFFGFADGGDPELLHLENLVSKDAES